jgi:hypothetical protein
LKCPEPRASTDLYQYQNLQAENDIAQRQVQFLQRRYQLVGRDIFATTQNIDVRAFGGAQSGVPTASTIQTALQAETSTFNSITTLAPENLSFHPPCDLPRLQDWADDIRQKLRQIILPQSGFPDCMALSANSSAPSAPTDGASPAASGSTVAVPGGGAQSVTPAQKPVALPFQVLPVSAPSQGQQSAPADLQTDQIPITVSADNSVPALSGTVVVKIIGGTPPYYPAVANNAAFTCTIPGAKPVEVDLNLEATIIHETETDPFASYEVKLSRSLPGPLPVGAICKSKLGSQKARLLFADQGGAQQFVTLKPVPSTTGTGTPSPVVCPKPCPADAAKPCPADAPKPRPKP